jgi:hypothetical protein
MLRKCLEYRLDASAKLLAVTTYTRSGGIAMNMRFSKLNRSMVVLLFG